MVIIIIPSINIIITSIIILNIINISNLVIINIIIISNISIIIINISEGESASRLASGAPYNVRG